MNKQNFEIKTATVDYWSKTNNKNNNNNKVIAMIIKYFLMTLNGDKLFFSLLLWNMQLFMAVKMTATKTCNEDYLIPIGESEFHATNFIEQKKKEKGMPISRLTCKTHGGTNSLQDTSERTDRI